MSQQREGDHKVTRRLLATLVVGTCVCLAVPALAGAVTFSNPAAITINNGTSECTDVGLASPYPSDISVSGTGTVTDVNVTLTGLTHTFPDDVGVLLVGPGGESVVLMADVGGGFDVSGVNLTFDDEAAGSIPDEGSQIVSSTYQPSSGAISDCPASFPAPAPTGPYGSSLSVFDGTDPNGTWSLYVIDDFPDDAGSIDGGWSLDITTEDTTEEEEKVADLRDLVASLDIHHGIANALDSKLRAALAALEEGDTAGACDSLRAFLNQVAAQEGKKLTEAEAEQLTDAATEIRTLLDC
jgi:subtilisin-like proprotein convertase family protein